MKLVHAAALALVCMLTVPAPPNLQIQALAMYNIPTMAACEAELRKIVFSYDDANKFCKCSDAQARSTKGKGPEPGLKSN
jgi:hypothetical protein